jgi:hypothetical protein
MTTIDRARSTRLFARTVSTPLVLAWTMVLSLTSCGGGEGGDGVDITEPEFSISLAISHTEVTLPIGRSATVTVNVTRGGNYGGPVTFAVEGLPSYVQATFNPATIAGSSSQSTLTLTAASSADPGTHSLTIRAAGPDVDPALATLRCNLQLVPDFSLSTTFPTLATQQGASVQNVIKVERSGGFAGGVALALEGTPAGVTAVFDPNPASGSASNVTISVGATVAVGSYPMTVRGTAPSIGDRTTSVTLEVSTAGGYSLSIAPTTVSLPAPGTATATITIQRSPGFTAPVSLWPENFPNGVTVSSAQNPVTGNTVTVTLTATAQAVPGTYATSVRGEVQGQPERRVTFQLVVQAATGFSIAPVSTSVVLLAGGQPQVVSYAVSRSGGFTGTVSFSVSTLPAGISATFDPQSTAGNESRLSVTAATGVAAQSLTATVRATSAGVPDQTATLGITVVTAATSVDWRFCGSTPQPVFLAYQDGASPFRVVTAAPDGVYRTPFATTRGAVAFVLPTFEAPLDASLDSRTQGLSARRALASAGGHTTHVYYGNVDELRAAAQEQCLPVIATKTVHGSVAGVPPAEAFGVILGTSVALGNPGGPYTFSLTGVLDGPRDALAARLAVTEGSGGDDDVGLTPTRFVLRRALNPPDGGTLPVFDFASAEAFDPASASVTLGNTQDASVELSSAFATANGTFSPISIDLNSSATTRPYYGLPGPRLQFGDLHAIVASDNRNREVLAFRRDVAPWTVDFGPTIPQALVDVFSTSPVVRLRGRIAVGRPTLDYGGELEASFIQAAHQRAILMHFGQSALAISPSYELRTPDFSGLQGWIESLYGLQSGSPVDFELNAMNTGSFVPADGAVLRSVRYEGRLTP